MIAVPHEADRDNARPLIATRLPIELFCQHDIVVQCRQDARLFRRDFFPLNSRDFRLFRTRFSLDIPSTLYTRPD